MLPAATLSNLPSAFQASANSCLQNFIAADRGHVRANNDRAFDARATFFANWCAARGFNKHYFRQLTDDDCILVLSTFLSEVLAGNNLKKSHDLSSQTVSNYLVSAKAVLQTLASRSIDIYDASSMSRQPRYHPLLGQLLSERRKWTKPLPQKEPFTTEMFQWMLQSLQQEPLPLVAFLGRRFCVYDWMRLGIFTGFRVSEYGQSQLRAGQRFQRVPDSADVPPQYRNMPLAFVAADFSFFDASQRLIPHALLWEQHQAGRVHLLEITWRYDKSAHNFAKRRFLRTGHPIFDPVDAA
eukprot:scaffold4591_cov88-Cylindrotheca_fusiformis.AAC.1